MTGGGGGGGGGGDCEVTWAAVDFFKACDEGNLLSFVSSAFLSSLQSSYDSSVSLSSAKEATGLWTENLLFCDICISSGAGLASVLFGLLFIFVSSPKWACSTAN